MSRTENELPLKIASYLDLHGWDRTSSPEFHAWLRTQGIDVETLAVLPESKQLSFLFPDVDDALSDQAVS